MRPARDVVAVVVLTMLASSGCFGLSDRGSSDELDPAAPVSGGTIGASDSDPAPAPRPRDALAQCYPGDATYDRMQQLYAATDSSVHELVTCGGAQVALAKTFLARILLSNPEAFDMDEDTRAELGALFDSTADNPFIHDADGGWLMRSTSGARDVTFDVYFRDGDEVVREDPLRMDSYLVGVHVAAAITWQDMKAHWDQKNTYVFTWDAPGPLAHLLNGGAPLPESIVLSLSIWDFVMVYLGEPIDVDFGALRSLGDVAMDSTVVLEDRPIGVTVDYTFSGTRVTVGDLGNRRKLGFTVDSLDATLDDLALGASTEDLGYSGAAAGLSGAIRYDIAGPSASVEVVADFGAGALYPTSTWRCPPIAGGR